MPKVTKKTLNCRGRLVDLTQPAVMGILNATPDSFFAGSRDRRNNHSTVATAGQMLARALPFWTSAATLPAPARLRLARSKRPSGCYPLSRPFWPAFPMRSSLLIRSGLRWPGRRLHAGAAWLTTLRAARWIRPCSHTVAELGVPYILMHLRGTPQTMQSMATYKILFPK